MSLLDGWTIETEWKPSRANGNKGWHTEANHYDVTIYAKNGATWSGEYSQGPMVADGPTLGGVVLCLASDSTCADVHDLDEFAEVFGYTKPTEAIAAFEGCQRAAKFLKAAGADAGELFEELDR